MLVLCLTTFLFVFVVIFVFQHPVKYHYDHWFFSVVSSATRLVYPFFGGIVLLHETRNTFPRIFGQSSFLVVFRIWRKTGYFCRNLSFRVHMLRLYQDANCRRLTDSSIRMRILEDWLTHPECSWIMFKYNVKNIY